MILSLQEQGKWEQGMVSGEAEDVGVQAGHDTYVSEKWYRDISVYTHFIFIW